MRPEGGPWEVVSRAGGWEGDEFSHKERASAGKYPRYPQAGEKPGIKHPERLELVQGQL